MKVTFNSANSEIRF